MQPKTIVEKTQRAASDFVYECETEYRNKICRLVREILSLSEKRPIVLISGPSGSGKTTTARLLEKEFEKTGIETHVLSLDNYFHPLTEKEKEQFALNQLDLESPIRLDTDLLNRQLSDLHHGRTIMVPRFDFITNTRRDSGKTLTLHPGELIILEGIHALNPNVIDAEDYTTRIYVSVRTRIALPNDRFLHPSKIRLARRMIRDSRTRGRSFESTVDLYESVERGENLYIMPYKHRAHFDVDTFHACELSVYKNFLPSSMPMTETQFPWLSELFEALSLLPVISPDLVSENSLLREFIGGGVFGD